LQLKVALQKGGKGRDVRGLWRKPAEQLVFCNHSQQNENTFGVQGEKKKRKPRKDEGILRIVEGGGGSPQGGNGRGKKANRRVRIRQKKVFIPRGKK